MSADELIEMADALEIPNLIVVRTQSLFSSIEALGLTCARFQTAGDLNDLSTKYCRTESTISEIVNWVVEYIDNTWQHLLEFDHNHLLSP